MGWRDRLQPAQFKRIPFFVTEAEASSGRKIAEHEFIGSDVPELEDLGRQAVRFRVRALVVGVDYDLTATALETALQRRGHGTLVHPAFGTRSVQALRYRRSESTANGGFATFEIDFQETDLRAQAGPRPAPDPARGTELAGVFLAELVGEDLVANLKTGSGFPGFLSDAAAAATAAAGKVAQGARFVQGLQAQVAAYRDQITSIIDTAAQLVTAPAQLVADVLEAVDQIRRTGMNALDSLEAYRTLFGVESGNTPGTSTLTVAANRNRNLVADLFRVGAVANAAVLVTTIAWPSRQEAEAVRAEIEAQLDELATRASDDTFQAIADLRTQLVAAVPDVLQAVPELGTFTPTATLPVLVLAYRLHDDVAEAAGIVSRNGVRHPAFVAGGVALEVVANG